MGAFTGQKRSECYNEETIKIIDSDHYNWAPPGKKIISNIKKFILITIILIFFLL